MKDKVKVIIIDDEKPARDLIKVYLKDFEEIEIAAECENGFAGIIAIHEYKPELIFLDIQMPKVTGFEMLEVLEDEDPAIIFSTAYDEYAIKAFEHHTIDYLLKPYTKTRFAQAVNKALNEIEKGNSKSAKEISETLNYESSKVLERIVVKENDEIVIIPIDKVKYFEAQGDYIHIYTDKKRYIKMLTLKKLEQSLNPSNFIRVHRGYIIQIKHITKIEKYTKDSFLAILKTDEKIPVSKSGYKKLKETLGF